MSPRGRIAAGVGLALYVGLCILVQAYAAEPLPPLVWVPIVHAVVLAVVCGLTALLVFGQADSTGRRAYLMLGSTYLFVAVLLLSFPMYFPGGFGGSEPLIGSMQSAPRLFYLWHFVFVIGLSVSCWMFRWEPKRRPEVITPALTTRYVVATVIGALLAVLLAGMPGPSIYVPDAGVNALGTMLDHLFLILSVAGTVLAFSLGRGGSPMQRWLAAALLLQLGAALANLNTNRWTFGWYFDRVFGAFAMTTLLIILGFELSRVGRMTHSVAARDPLTQCQSRAGFTQSLNREIAGARGLARSLALLWIDLDGFKGVNDQFGHRLGDQVLNEMGARIRHQVREHDHVGRLGGDEFGVLLCDWEGDDHPTVVAERLLATLREPVHVDDLLLHVTASIGVAALPADGLEPDELMTRADLAMYSAKNSGGDRAVTFSEDLGSDAVDRAQLRHELARAVHARDFELAYQPIVDLTDGVIGGVEALARWSREDEWVSAGEFIAFAEASGQIVAIGRQLLEVLERDIDQVLAVLPPDAFLSVNLSARELADDRLIDQLITGPLRSRSERVVIEVTESAQLVPGGASLGDIVDRLRGVGYGLAIDDFGAGLSNFDRLQQLRPDMLKVDRSLVVRAGSGLEGGMAFLSAARSVAESLGCRIVAEGVETESERAAVEQLGIRLAQGNLLGEPVSLPRLPIYLGSAH